MVLTQFAHNLLDRGEFSVSTSENNWNGVWVVKIGIFGGVGVPEVLVELLPGGV